MSEIRPCYRGSNKPAEAALGYPVVSYPTLFYEAEPRRLLPFRMWIPQQLFI